MISSRTVRNHTTAVRFLNAQRVEFLAVAEQITEMAARILASGDVDAAAELIAAARVYMDRVAEIDACKVAA